MVWYDVLEFNVPYSTQYRSFRRRLVRWPALLETRASRLQSARKRLADYTHPSCVLEEALITCVQVCIRSAMFSLLARMRYGLYYNMPLVRRGFGDNALYKSTFYLLTYLLTYLLVTSTVDLGASRPSAMASHAWTSAKHGFDHPCVS